MVDEGESISKSQGSFAAFDGGTVNGDEDLIKNSTRCSVGVLPFLFVEFAGPHPNARSFCSFRRSCMVSELSFARWDEDDVLLLPNIELNASLAVLATLLLLPLEFALLGCCTKLGDGVRELELAVAPAPLYWPI